LGLRLEENFVLVNLFLLAKSYVAIVSWAGALKEKLLITFLSLLLFYFFSKVWDRPVLDFGREFYEQTE